MSNPVKIRPNAKYRARMGDAVGGIKGPVRRKNAGRRLRKGRASDTMEAEAMPFRLQAPWVHSLKEKRMTVQSLIAKL